MGSDVLVAEIASDVLAAQSAEVGRLRDIARGCPDTRPRRWQAVRMALRSTKTWWGVVLDAPDGPALAHFYARLLDWQVFGEDGDGAAVAPSAETGYNLSFQTEQHYVRPVWPAEPGEPQMSMHLDIEVDDLDEAVAHAVSLGAELAGLPAAGDRAGAARPRRAPVLPLPRPQRRPATDDRQLVWLSASSRSQLVDAAAPAAAVPRAGEAPLGRDVLALPSASRSDRCVAERGQVVRRGPHVEHPDLAGQREAVGHQLGGDVAGRTCRPTCRGPCRRAGSPAARARPARPGSAARVERPRRTR